MSSKRKTTDIRHDYLSALVNAIFDIKVNSTMKGENNSVTVVRGSGREIGKCNFTELYRTDFTRLFEYTFTYENCEFKYDGLQKAKQRFDRSIAIKNAIVFFRKKNIMLNYVFHSRAESKLFSRLIYRYIKQLLDVLFDEYFISNKKKFEEVVAEKYEKTLAQIRDEIDTTDIHELIYKDAKLSDAELLSYDGADSIMLVDSGYEYMSYYSSENINKSLKLKPAGKGLVYSHSNMSYNIYNIDSKDSIAITYNHNIEYYPVKIFDLQRKEFFVPRFFCVEFKLSEISTSLEDEAEDKKRVIYDMLSTRVNEYITKKYIRTEKQAANRLENIEGILIKLLQINYTRLFSDDRYFENYFKLGLGRFRKFIAISNLESNNELILFRYLVSVWVDEFSHILFCMQSDQEYKKSIEGKKLLKHKEVFSNYVKTNNLNEANKYFCNFYNCNKKIIDSFKKKVDILNISYFNIPFEENINKRYSPYSHLKEALEAYYAFISTNADKMKKSADMFQPKSDETNGLH